MSDEIQFPLDFDVCPNCGSTKRVANELVQVEKEHNLAPLGMKAWLWDHQTIIADKKSPPVSAPVVAACFDVCVDCGTLYCVHVEVTRVSMLATPDRPNPYN